MLVVNPVFSVVEYCPVLQYFILDVVDFMSATYACISQRPPCDVLGPGSPEQRGNKSQPTNVCFFPK